MGLGVDWHGGLGGVGVVKPKTTEKPDDKLRITISLPKGLSSEIESHYRELLLDWAHRGSIGERPRLSHILEKLVKDGFEITKQEEDSKYTITFLQRPTDQDFAEKQPIDNVPKRA